MYRMAQAVVTCGLGLLWLSGCGGSDAPRLAEAGGIVSFDGQPLAGANVVFVPEQGPVATGITDEQGRFVLSTRGQPGALIGPHTVAITAFEQRAQEASDDANGQQHSRIPARYGNRTTSGLTAIVTGDRGSDNFTFSLEKSTSSSIRRIGPGG